jgi:putative ABC transport system ATP-binding protein
MPNIECIDLKKDYRLGKTEIPALRSVTCSFASGEFVTLMGPSGSGKSTLLNLLGLVDSPSRGEIRFDSVGVSTLSDRNLTRFRGERIGFVFQNFNLIPILTIRENIEFPLTGSGLSAKEVRGRSSMLMDETGLAGLENRFPNEVSGGQRQRAAIARALIRDPSLVLADEPTANLDSETGKTVIRVLRDMAREKGSTVILATHDPEITGVSDRILHLRDGMLGAEEKGRGNGKA